MRRLDDEIPAQSAILKKSIELLKQTAVNPVAGIEYARYLTTPPVADGRLIEEANVVLKKAAEAGMPEAFVEYGLVLQRQRQAGEALQWFKKGAEHGHPPCMWRYASLLKDGGEGVAADQQTAALWCKKAADDGYLLAQVMYADMLRDGTGVDRNEGEAARYRRLANGEVTLPQAERR
jgi:TPR repeat protein